MTRVLLVSASVGSGHTRAADELQRRLDDSGCLVDAIDLLSLGEGEGQQMRETYAWLLNHVPVVYDLAMRFWARWPWPLERFVAAQARSVEDDLRRIAAQQHPDLVVSVYNLASQCLGRLRAEGALQAPVVTCVIDPGPHPYWVHPAVDRHVTVLPDTAGGLRRYGARGVALAAPLVRPAFAAAEDPRAARQRLGLPDNRLVLLTAGSWASGHILETLDLLLDGCDAIPVVLCAHDEGVHRNVSARKRAIALDWVDDMPALLAACDVVIDNAGGLTCWEALIADRPVVLFRPLPGHGRLNAATLAERGLVRWVRRGPRLAPVVQTLVSEAAPVTRRMADARSALPGDDPAHVILQTMHQTT